MRPDLPNYFGGCNAKFKICRALNCKRGRLVTARHNNLRDRFADPAGKAFAHSHVRDNPLIFTGCAVKRLKAKPDKTIGSTNWDSAPPPEVTEQKEYLLIHDLWLNGTNSVHDMHVVNTDPKSHPGKTPKKYLKEAERAKRRMYLEA